MKKLLVILTIVLSFTLTACKYQAKYEGNYAYFQLYAQDVDFELESGYAIAFPKNSTLTNEFNTIINFMLEDGSLACFNEHYVEQVENSCYEELDFTKKVYEHDFNGNGETLKVMTSAGYEPFEYYEKGKLAGYDIALANFIAKELNYKLDWIDGEFDSIILNITQGQVDLAIAAITPTEDRKKNVDFSEEYYFESYTVGVYRENDRLNSLDDLKGKKIAAQSGTVQALLIQELEKLGLIKEAVLVPYPANAMQYLKTNKVDAFMVEKSIADDLFKTYNK